VLFPERMSEAVQPQSVVENLAAFIDRLAFLGLQLEGDNALLLHVIVSYINMVMWPVHNILGGTFLTNCVMLQLYV
jgi:hypothetical protein